MSELNFYLSVVTAYANHASGIFNLFITVMFGSYAFAAAISLKGIGKPILNMSSSSVCVGLSLVAFYIISFLFFNSATNKAASFLRLIQENNNNILSEPALKILNSSALEIGCFELQNIGFIIGATVSVIVFMWLSNASRPNTK